MSYFDLFRLETELGEHLHAKVAVLTEGGLKGRERILEIDSEANCHVFGFNLVARVEVLAPEIQQFDLPEKASSRSSFLRALFFFPSVAMGIPIVSVRVPASCWSAGRLSRSRCLISEAFVERKSDTLS
ncbi:hypothetical protein [Paraburkholderia youngii]|uniref:hypothetical protein n=1 Tax=Paraburkholderia youngii TaxID=2782701 RepID=UPI003D24612A